MTTCNHKWQPMIFAWCTLAAQCVHCFYWKTVPEGWFKRRFGVHAFNRAKRQIRASEAQL